MLRCIALVLLCMLAGCSGPRGDPAATGADDAPFGTEPLVATSTTGILRGYATDAALRPLLNVSVDVQHPGGEHTLLRTTANGDFGLDGLAPGTYVVRGDLPGYLTAQAVAHVRAGVDEPEPVRLRMERDLETVPYVIAGSYDGFVPCGVRAGTGGVHCGALSQVRPAISDRSQFTMPVDPIPSFAQAEMLWQSTQPLADQMGVYFRTVPKEGNDQYMGIYPLNQGMSPLLLSVNETGVGSCMTCIEEPWVMHGWEALELSVRTGELSSTTPPETCAPSGSPCLTGLGATTNQKVQLFVHVLYRAVPPDGWTFSQHGEPL